MPTTLQVNTQQVMQMGTHTEKLQNTIQTLQFQFLIPQENQDLVKLMERIIIL